MHFPFSRCTGIQFNDRECCKFPPFSNENWKTSSVAAPASHQFKGKWQIISIYVAADADTHEVDSMARHVRTCNQRAVDTIVKQHKQQQKRNKSFGNNNNYTFHLQTSTRSIWFAPGFLWSSHFYYIFDFAYERSESAAERIGERARD